MAYKAKKIETFRDKYFSHVVYEYRGLTYEVEYANGWNVCCTPAHVQHRDRQAEIDKVLDNPAPTRVEGEPVTMDEIFEMMGWNE